MNHFQYARKVSLFFIAFVSVVLLNLIFNASLSNPSIEPRASLSSRLPVSVSKHISMGYNNLSATFTWFKTNAYFGSHINDTDYNYLARFFHTIITLHPKFEPVYYMSASVFPWNTGSTKISKPILLKAMIEFPNDWRWAYYRGFNSYWFEHDYQQAAHFFELSSHKPNAPSLVSSLAARMHAQAGSIDTALTFLARLIQNKNDSNTHKALMRQYKQLKTEKQLQELEKWLSMLPENQRNLQGVRQLRKQGYAIPERLEDGGYIIFVEGEPVSSLSKKRFKVFVPPKHQGVAQDETTH